MEEDRESCGGQKDINEVVMESHELVRNAGIYLGAVWRWWRQHSNSNNRSCKFVRLLENYTCKESGADIRRTGVPREEFVVQKTSHEGQ